MHLVTLQSDRAGTETQLFYLGKLIYLKLLLPHLQSGIRTLINSGLHAYVLSCYSCVQLFVTQGAIARQVPLSMGLPRQEYWSALPYPPPGNLSHPWIKPAFPALQVDSLRLSHQGSQIVV